MTDGHAHSLASIMAGVMAIINLFQLAPFQSCTRGVHNSAILLLLHVHYLQRHMAASMLGCYLLPL